MSGAAENDQNLTDVLASIRRLIAQDAEQQIETATKHAVSRPGIGAVAAGGGGVVNRPMQKLSLSPDQLSPKAAHISALVEREIGRHVHDELRLVLNESERVESGEEQAESGENVQPRTSEGPVFSQTWTEAQPPMAECANSPKHEEAVPEPQEFNDNFQKEAAMTPEAQIEANEATMQENEGFDLFANDFEDEQDDQLAGGNALRSLVRDVLRQELQGELGNRISRNMRRAIRQEVAAAITAGLKLH